MISCGRSLSSMQTQLHSCCCSFADKLITSARVQFAPSQFTMCVQSTAARAHTHTLSPLSTICCANHYFCFVMASCALLYSSDELEIQRHVLIVAVGSRQSTVSDHCCERHNIASSFCVMRADNYIQLYYFQCAH